MKPDDMNDGGAPLQDAPAMPEESPSSGLEKSQRQVALLRLGAVVVIAVVAIILALALIHGNSKSKKSGSHVYTLKQLKAYAATLDHPIYWVGQRKGARYEVKVNLYDRKTKTTLYGIGVRYLTGKQNAGHSPVTEVWTWKSNGAYATVKKSGVQRGNFRLIGLKHKMVAESLTKYKGGDFFAAVPSLKNYMLEVFTPTYGTAQSLIQQGSLVRVPTK